MFGVLVVCVVWRVWCDGGGDSTCNVVVRRWCVAVVVWQYSIKAGWWWYGDGGVVLAVRSLMDGVQWVECMWQVRGFTCPKSMSPNLPSGSSSKLPG